MDGFPTTEARTPFKMSHDHDHSHGHHHGHEHHHGHGHDHMEHARSMSDTGLAIAVIVNLFLTVVEVVAGVISGSLALLADALHNFSDCAALVVAWVARRISRRRPDASFTFGYGRAELIGAIINLTALIVLSGYLLMEAVLRAFSPPDIQGDIVMWVSLVAIVVDVATAVALASFAKDSLNIKAAFLHNITDALSSVVVMIGGALILYFGWNWIDTALTFLIAGYILAQSLPMLKKASHILMDGVDDSTDIQSVYQRLDEIEHVERIYHLHLRQIDESMQSLEATIVVTQKNLPLMENIKQDIKSMLHDSFDINHSTLEFEIQNANPSQSSDSSMTGGSPDCGYPRTDA